MMKATPDKEHPGNEQEGVIKGHRGTVCHLETDSSPGGRALRFQATLMERDPRQHTAGHFVT